MSEPMRLQLALTSADEQSAAELRSPSVTEVIFTIFSPSDVAIASALSLAFAEAARSASSCADCFVFQSENQTIHIICSGLHRAIDQAANEIQAHGFNSHRVAGIVADDFRLAALRIAIRGSQRISAGFYFIVFAQQFL